MQQPSDFATPQRAAGSGGHRGANTQPHAGQPNTRFDVLHTGSRSCSPTPRFPSEAAALSTRSPLHGHPSHSRQSSQRVHRAPPQPFSQQRQATRQPRPHIQQHSSPSHQQEQQQQQQQQRTPSPGFDRRSRRVVGDRGASGGWRQRGDSISEADARATSVSAGNPHRGGSSGAAHTYTRRLSPSGNSPDEERRRSQREKQIQYGYVTDGYTNMKRLIAHDPLLQSGGILPLSPPAIVKGSKRLWDIQLRKWRRALHMFDHVFIEGEDDPATRATVLEEQRLQWVSEAFHDVPREGRVRISLDALRRVQTAATVPRKIPVEDDLRCILRRDDCYESVRSVVPQSASSLTKGTDISPLEAGIKIHIAPSAAVLQRQQAQLGMQQRLSSLHQQQTAAGAAAGSHTDADVAPPSLAAEALTKASAAAPTQCPSPSAPRDGSWQQQQQQQLTCEHSPSPRRPPVTSSLEPLTTPSRVLGAAPHSGATHPRSESVTTPQQQRTRLLSAAAAEVTGPARKYSDGADSQSGSPAPRGSAAAAGQGLSASKPHASSASRSPAPTWGATRAGAEPPQAPFMPRSTALAPPPPLPGTRTGASRTSAAPAEGSAVSPLWTTDGHPSPNAEVSAAMPRCGHCGHAVWAPAVPAPGGGFIFYDTHGGNAFAPGVAFPDAAPHVPGAAAAHAAAMAPQPFSAQAAGPYVPGHLSGTHYLHQQQMHSGVAHAPQLYAAPGTREARRRSGAAGGAAVGVAGTPQTVPRFVARLSSSPNEQRLGDCRGDAAAGHVPHALQGITTATRAGEASVGSAPAALLPSPATVAVTTTSGVVTQVAEHAVCAEVRRSLVAVTPKRALFDAGVIADGVSTEARQLPGRRTLGSPSPQHFDPLRDSPFGKPGALTDAAEDVPVVPLVFDADV